MRRQTTATTQPPLNFTSSGYDAMLALTTALITAVLAILGKTCSDRWQRDQERRGVAGALAGEIGAYIEPFQGVEFPMSMRIIAKYDRNERRARLCGFPDLPSGHPVFDALADKTGMLPPDLARQVSAFYNAVTGLRLLMGNLSSDRFLSADDDYQRGQLEAAARLVEIKIVSAQNLVDALIVESQRRML